MRVVYPGNDVLLGLVFAAVADTENLILRHDEEKTVVRRTLLAVYSL